MDAVKEALAASLQNRRDVRLAVLFGSFARGRANEQSDVDVAVLAPGVDLRALASDLTLACDREVDVVTLDEPSIPMLAAIVRDGVPIREADRRPFAAWRSGALMSLELDLPWYHRMRDAWLHRLAGGRL